MKKKITIIVVTILVVVLGTCAVLKLIGSNNETKIAFLLVMGSNKDDSGSRDKDENYLGIVCLDPGHGGPVSETAPELQEVEKADVLELSLKVRKILEENNIKVIMTRTEDVEVTLEDRCKVANEANADLFVSIHRNISNIEGVGSGIEIWLALEKGEIEGVIGEIFERKFKEAHIQNFRGLKYGSMSNFNVDYIVNRNTTMPSCLIETGFMTNEEDNRLLYEYNDEYAAKIAEAIVESLAEIKQMQSESNNNTKNQ